MPKNDTFPKLRSGPSDFATTQWSLVLEAGDNERTSAHAALSKLCEVYWQPLYGYARRRVASVDEAQDLTQAFFLELLEKNYVGTATPSRGRFRAFLLTAFKNYMSKQWGKGRAQKRGGGRAPLSLDFAAADSSLDIEPTAGLTPEQLYDRQWVMKLLEKILERLADEFGRTGKSKQFQVLLPFIIKDQAGTTYAEAAKVLGTTEGATKQAATRMRQTYRLLLREEIAQTVVGPEEVDDEIRKLFSAFTY